MTDNVSLDHKSIENKEIKVTEKYEIDFSKNSIFLFIFISILSVFGAMKCQKI